MTIKALNLLIDSGFLSASGALIDLTKLPDIEISNRISQYINGRIQIAESELHEFEASDGLSALFSTSSSDVTKDKLLSSSLVYESMIIDDPLVSSFKSIDPRKLAKRVELFSWAFELIKAGFVKVLPISYFNRPSGEVPLLSSDDAFKSAIPDEIYNFIHENAIVSSVVRDDEGQMLILNEGAEVSRRTALNISFKDDYWVSGVSLYLFQTLENCKKNNKGELVCQQVWEPDGCLDKKKFEAWSYQSINQAMRSRLIHIYNESYLANITGHTYITESSFESKFMSMPGISENSTKSTSAQFLEANDSFIYIRSPDDVVELRTKYAGAFERFNYSLMSVSDELSGVDPMEFDLKSRQLFLTEIQPQIDEIRCGMSSIYSAATKGSLLSLCGLVAAISTGSSVPLIASLIGVAGGLSEAFPDISKAQRKKKEPAYIWHRVTKT